MFLQSHSFPCQSLLLGTNIPYDIYIYIYIYMHMYIWICIYICDRIWENMHSSHIRFCSFGDSYKPQGMVYRYETLRDDKGIVVLQSLKVHTYPLFQIDFMSHIHMYVCMYPRIYVWLYVTYIKSGLKLSLVSQHHWPRWPTDPDSNPGQTLMWPGLIKVQAYAETYISGTTLIDSVL